MDSCKNWCFIIIGRIHWYFNGYMFICSVGFPGKFGEQGASGDPGIPGSSGDKGNVGNIGPPGRKGKLNSTNRVDINMLWATFSGSLSFCVSYLF